AKAALSALRSGEISAEDLTKDCLQRIETHNPTIRGFREIIAGRALDDARKIDARRASGASLGPLAGLPVAVKENIDTTPARCSAGLAFRADNMPTADAVIGERLRATAAASLGVAVSAPGAFGVKTEIVTHPADP